MVNIQNTPLAQAYTPGPGYQAPRMSPHELWRQRIDGFANNLILGLPAVPHDAAANPPLSARIDFLA